MIGQSIPFHDANPLKEENLPDLRQKVVELGADFGAAFDGDGDRCALVDEKGDIVTCDMTTALLAKYYLAKEKGPIAYDLRSSKAVAELIEELGGTAVETRVDYVSLNHPERDRRSICQRVIWTLLFQRLLWRGFGPLSLYSLANVISQGESLSYNFAHKTVSSLGRN